MRRSPSRFGWILLVSAGAVALTVDGAAEDAADPWATMRACLVILDRFAGCSPDKTFAPYVERWIDTETPGPKASRKEIERRLRWWMRPVGRREQCAIWARRTGAPEHVGRDSPLAKIARNEKSACEELARTIDKEKWIPAALVDARQD